jgi:MFS transporter, MHS family, shikimate and dehydroshikimate transport protein
MANPAAAAPTVAPDDPLTREKLRVAFAAMIGAIIEWYDFFAYGTAAALVFREVFFPNLSPTLGLVVSYGTFSVGYLARPLGAVLMGHVGDKVGRKGMLVLTVVTMGIATVLIGFLPGYATIGIWAPILLIVLRLVQGFAVGGEVGGAILIAVEHAPRGRRGLFSGFPQIGVAAGLVLANLVFLGANLSMSPADFLAYGWRIPFIGSFVLVAVGLYIRLRISESPVFLAMRAAGHATTVPLVDLFRRGWSMIIRIILSTFFPNTLGYITLFFILSYGTQTLHLTRSTLLTFVIVANACEVLMTLYSGALSDRLGRKRTLLLGSGVGIVMGALFFPMVDTAIPAVVFVAILIVRLGIAAMWGPWGAMISEQFDTNIRYTAIGVCTSLSSIIGAQTPSVAALLAAGSNGSLMLSIFLCLSSVVAFVAIATIPDTTKVALTDELMKRA